MLKRIQYRGGIITDTGVPGERKAEGILPAHANGSLQVSRDRWLSFFATLDPGGWDSVRSIVFQLRADAPDGDVVREGLVSRFVSGWDPLDEGIRLRKVNGMPMAFGVPKGARRNGQVMSNQNAFVVKWYRYGMLEQDGRLLNSQTHRDLWPEGSTYKRSLLRIEWMQFRLNDSEDDIEITGPPGTLRQSGYESDQEFCSLGPGHFMNHAMTPPVAADPSCTTWVECDTFGADPDHPNATHGQVAPVEYTWNGETGLYEWSRTGPLTGIPGRVIGETSISRFDGSWVAAARTFDGKGETVWFRTEEPFRGLGEPVIRPGSVCPRHSFRCADGVLRLFINDRNGSPHGDGRNPLYVFEVDPVTLEYSNPETVVDLRAEGLPFNTPFADMSKLCPNQGNRQLLFFRTIDRQHTADLQPGEAPLGDPALRAAGIHYAELVYEGKIADPWCFEEAVL